MSAVQAMTLTEKIIARAASLAHVRPGQIVTGSVDLAMMHDSGGPRRVDSKLRELGAQIWDVDKVVVVSDHYVPAVDADSAQILQFTRGWVAERGIPHFYDMRGICHVVIAEGGHVRPGMFAAGGDSHSPTGGAWGAFMVGIGATEMAGVLVTGSLWVRVPQTLRVSLHGAFAPFCASKDVLLHLCATLGLNNDYRVIEFAGSAMPAISMQERMTLCNMTAELGAKTGIIAPDARTVAALQAAGVRDTIDIARWQGDPHAAIEREVVVDLSALEPFVAAPHSPANAAPVHNTRGTRIDQAYIGACTGAKIEDLRMAASVLMGRKISPRVRLLIAPASSATTAQAASEGTLSKLLDAGAVLLPSGCGACAGLGAGVLASAEVCIASTARNFKGRMGASDAQVYLASPYTVAASALAGHIIDPREVGALSAGASA
jgi:3-isopropylmalate/(R)-2-methylmalate dehydratase large subunit